MTPLVSDSGRVGFGGGMALLLLLLAGCVNPQPHEATGAPADPWVEVPRILQRIVPPKFPARDYVITDHGAVGDGVTLNSAALAAAIERCATDGGGRVVVPAGRFYTGPIHLRSGVNLHLTAGAELIFSDNFEDYLPVVLVRVGGIELYNYSPLIYARDCTNIAITGPGKLNGNAQKWWAWKSSETKLGFEMGAQGVPVAQRIFGRPEFCIRPSFVSFVSCTNVLLADFTIGSGPNWTIHPIYCQNITIRGVRVLTDGPNNDGIDPDSCRDMLIENCEFSTGDDCVVLKSGYNQDGWRVGRPTENVVMRNCFSRRGHGGLVIGSEMSGGVRNVFLENCEFEGTDRAVRIKSRADRGGVVERIFARNLKVKDLRREVVILNMDYGSDRQQLVQLQPPVFRDMRFENISGAGVPTAILITGMAESPIANIHFRNFDIQSTKGVVASFTRGLEFDQVRVQPTTGPVFKLMEADGVTIRRATPAPGTEVFLQLNGPGSRAVQVQGGDLTGAKQVLQLGPEVRAEEVRIE